MRDGPGFYTTRIIGTMLGEATLLLNEGVGIEDVDRAMVAFGWPVGPFTLMDEVGLAVARHAGQTVAAAQGLSVQRTAVDVLVKEGLEGKRKGAGFYLYDGKKKVVNTRVYELLGMTPGAPHENVGERLTYLFVNAAARCLDDGTLRGPAEGDLGAVLGLGFPPFLGGPFRYADAIGTRALLERMEALAARHGARFEPAPLLVEKGRAGVRFHG